MSRLWVLDFDRCLGDSDALYEALERLLEERGLFSVQELAKIRHEVERSGGSFDPLRELQRGISHEQFDALVVAYTGETQPDEYLLPGAADLLGRLGEQGEPHMILTYGGEAWQRAKLARAGLAEVPTLIMTHAAKAKEIESWRDDDGFSLDTAAIMHGDRLPVSVCEIVLVDDKAKAFAGAGKDVRGYWVKTGELLASQQGTVPSQVVSVSSLIDILTREFEAA